MIKLIDINVDLLENFFGDHISHDGIIGRLKDIEISEDLNFDIRKFAKKYNVSSKYISNLIGIYICCKWMSNDAEILRGGSIDDQEMKKELKKLNQILESKIIELKVYSIDSKITLKNKSLLDFFQNYIKYNLKKDIPDFHDTSKRTYKRTTQIKSAKILFDIFSTIIPIPFKSKNQLYIPIYDFLNMVGYFSKKGLSQKSEIIKKLFQKPGTTKVLK